MKYHSLHYKSSTAAMIAKGTLEDLGLPLKGWGIKDNTVNFCTDEELDEATQALILKKVGASSSQFNEKPPYNQEQAIKDYTFIMGLDSHQDGSPRVPREAQEELDRLTYEASAEGLEFQYDEGQRVYVLVPKQDIKPIGFDEELSDDEDDEDETDND